MTEEDIVATSTKMSWQDVAGQKRRIQAETIAQFEASEGKTESAKLDQSVNLSVNVAELLRQIASAKLSCEDLAASRIRK